jgi:hypothetical protein
MKELLEVGTLRLRDVGIVVEAYVLGSEGRLNLLLPASVLVVDLSSGPLGDGCQLRLG